MKNKKKKVIVRIGAILACVLLVGSLAIPAFAATPYDNIETNFYNYLDTVGVTNTVRTGFIDGNYNPFIWDAITAGSVQFINDIDAGFYTTTNLPDFKSSMDCTYVYRVNNEEISIPHEGTLSIQLVGSRCLVTFSDDGNKIIEVTYNVSYVYDQTINARKAYFSYVGVYVFYDADTVNSLDIGILINNTEVAYFNNLLRLMFGHSSVGYPKTFQTSLDVYWHDGYNAGVQDGNTDGYNLGYENGYDVGASAGYESGYQAGLESGLDSDAHPVLSEWEWSWQAFHAVRRNLHTSRHWRHSGRPV